MVKHRLQILIDDEQHQRLKAAAGVRGVSVATIVREAIDRGLPAGDQRRRAAGRAFLDAEPMDVPDVPELLAELDALRGRRA